MAAARKLLILTDTVLTSIANDPNFRREFPSLASIPGHLANENTPRSNCSPCQARARARNTSLGRIKSSILALSNERKIRFKSMLDAEKIELRIAEGGQIRRYTF